MLRLTYLNTFTLVAFLVYFTHLLIMSYFQVVLWLAWICFENVPLEEPIVMIMSSLLCLLHGLIYNACQLELADILILEDVINILKLVYIFSMQILAVSISPALRI